MPPGVRSGFRYWAAKFYSTVGTYNVVIPNITPPSIQVPLTYCSSRNIAFCRGTVDYKTIDGTHLLILIPQPFNVNNVKVPHVQRKPPLRGYDVVIRNPSTGDTFTYISIPKCGSSSLRSYLGTGYVHKRELTHAADRDQSDTVFTVVRHPVARLISAFQAFWAPRPAWQNAHNGNFSDWWAYVRVHPTFDVHTTPQVDIIAGRPAHIMQLEQIEVWWPECRVEFPWVFPKEIPHENRSKSIGLELTDKEVQDIERVYAADLAIWRAAGV